MLTRNIKNALCVFFIVCSFACAVSCKSKDEKDFSKAQEYFDKKGFEKYQKYVEKNKYYAVRDEGNGGATPLLIAIESKNLSAAKAFLEKGASSIDEKDASGRGCVYYSLKSKDSGTIRYVASIMPENYWANPGDDGNLPCVEYIKNCGSFPDFKDVLDLTENFDFTDKNGKTLLMYAAQCNADVRTVKYLLDRGAAINAKNANEWTALMYAARYNPNPLVAEDLVLRGADMSSNSAGLSLLMLASCNKNPGVLMTLLKYKDDVNSKTSQGKTALMYACENGADSSIIKLLIDSGADVNMADNSGKTALMYALQNYKKPEAVYVLLAAGADENMADSSGKSARQYLLENNDLSLSEVKNAFGVRKNEDSDVNAQKSENHDENPRNDESPADKTENPGKSGVSEKEMN